MRVELLEVAAIGKRECATLHGPAAIFDYPPSENGKLFERLRRQLGVTIGDAAEALEIRPSQITGIKDGRLVFASLYAFAEAVELLVRKSENSK